jgi:hypothetical protein
MSRAYNIYVEEAECLLVFGGKARSKEVTGNT